MDLEFINSYTRILFEDDYKGADEFKNKAIPEVLFKYFPCRKNRLDALFDQKLSIPRFRSHSIRYREPPFPNDGAA